MEASLYYVAQFLLAALVAAIIFVFTQYSGHICLSVHLFMRRLRGLKTPTKIIVPEPAAAGGVPEICASSPSLGLGRPGLVGDELRDDFIKWLAVQRSSSDSADWRRRKFGVGERERPFHSLDGTAGGDGDDEEFDVDEDTDDDEVLMAGFGDRGAETAAERKAKDLEKVKKGAAIAALFPQLTGQTGAGAPQCPFEALFRSHVGAKGSLGLGLMDKKTLGHEIVRRARSIDENNLKTGAAAAVAASGSNASTLAPQLLNNLDASPRSSRDENFHVSPRHGDRGSAATEPNKQEGCAVLQEAEAEEEPEEDASASVPPPGAREYFKVSDQGRLHKYNELPVLAQRLGLSAEEMEEERRVRQEQMEHIAQLLKVQEERERARARVASSSSSSPSQKQIQTSRPAASLASGSGSFEKEQSQGQAGLGLGETPAEVEDGMEGDVDVDGEAEAGTIDQVTEQLRLYGI